MKRLKVGVFGVGSLGQHHARIYAANPEAELVGVYDINMDRAKEIAAQFKTQPFDQVDALAGQIEAASIAVPTDHHYKLACQLMQ